MFKKLSLFFGVICSLGVESILTAATPITHAYLTKSFFEHFPKYTKADESAFMVGTLFPDIRYLGDITRHETHCDDVTLEDVLSETDPFTAGVKFHCYVDVVRERLLIEAGLYDKVREKIPNNASTFIKLSEDEVLYHERNWNDVLVDLVTTYPQEKEYGVPDKSILIWHNLLTLLFIASPSYSLNLLSLTGKGGSGITAEDIKLWNSQLKPLSKEPLIQGWVWKMVSHFEKQYQLLKEAREKKVLIVS